MWGDQSKTGWSILCVFQSRFAFMTLAVCIEPLSLTQLTNRKLCQSLHYVLQMTVETFLVVFPDFLHILKMLCTKNFSFRFIIDSSSIRFVATDFQSSPCVIWHTSALSLCFLPEEWILASHCSIWKPHF